MICMTPKNVVIYLAGHVNERAVELESHQQCNEGSRTYVGAVAGHVNERAVELESHQQCNEGSRTFVGADPNSQQQIAKGRGFARPYVGWGTGAKLKVKLNKDNQPIGNTAGPLQSQLGILARNATLAPLTFTYWRAPELNPYKERIWVEAKVFIIGKNSDYGLMLLLLLFFNLSS
ncbi:hypothetical protein RHMOL_Rhmol11G0020600 [Rhododendron molle]|uniref:Uncharacterized protein n=1 Tax=Rhododendron molle TaxID=49168 RepID=A0ACC0LN24_RHOML|nr:hypothetical protein RHMOL_Rhmol11G0020600 [Rhododendron molle]